MLDREYDDPQDLDRLHIDTMNIGFSFGVIGQYNVAIIVGPPGQPGTVTGSLMASAARAQFPNMRHYLLVGIGGGIPRSFPSSNMADDDIHLGDVVVGCIGRSGMRAVVQHDLRRETGYGSEDISQLPNSRFDLRHAVRVFMDRLKAHGGFPNNDFVAEYQRLCRMQTGGIPPRYARPTRDSDRLFTATSRHHCIPCMRTSDPASPPCRCGGRYINDPCHECARKGETVVDRAARTHDQPVFHISQIASGNLLVENAAIRDEIARRHPEAGCLEMEAAGAIGATECLVIKGISDYCDTHRSGLWSDYSAVMAAVFARTFLLSNEFRRICSPGSPAPGPTRAASLTGLHANMDHQLFSPVSSPAIVQSHGTDGGTIASDSASETTRTDRMCSNIFPGRRKALA